MALHGNDDANGEAAVQERAGGDAPFRTIQRALQAVRERRTEAPEAELEIVIGEGRHELNELLLITPAEAGSGKLVIRGQEGGKTILSGGKAIAGPWKRSERNEAIWETVIPEVLEGKWFFRQLFINGERKIRARTPNEGFFRVDGASPQDKPVRLKFHGNDIKPEWAQSGDVEVIAFLAWADIRMQIREVDEEKQVAVLSGDPRPSNRENNARYFVENAREFLDAEGEWDLDKKTGVLSYFARAGEDLSKAEVIAPKLDELVVLQGDIASGELVRNVTFTDLTFSDTDWTIGPNGYADTQAAVATRGELRAEGAVDCVVENCRFTHLAGYAIELGKGARSWKIVGNEMVDLGAGGVRLGETRAGEEPEANHSHAVTDNHMHQLGRIYYPAVGVFILQSGTNRIAHNHIHDLYYTAVSVGWTWGYRETPCRANVIEFNHMHDIGQSMLSDMGAVYTLGMQRGTVVRNNLIHDVKAFTYGGWGLYTDEGSTDIVMENNLVYGCKNAGFHQHYGRENVIRNNIFAFNVENQVMRTRPEEHISFFFTNNIVYFDSGNLLGSNWSNDNYRMDHNVYWDTRLAENPEAMRFSGASLEEWRKRGHDVHSLVADPKFVDAAERNFALREDSPALKLGFKPIDLSGVGIRPKGQRK